MFTKLNCYAGILILSICALLNLNAQLLWEPTQKDRDFCKQLTTIEESAFIKQRQKVFTHQHHLKQSIAAIFTKYNSLEKKYLQYRYGNIIEHNVFWNYFNFIAQDGADIKLELFSLETHLKHAKFADFYSTLTQEECEEMAVMVQEMGNVITKDFEQIIKAFEEDPEINNKVFAYTKTNYIVFGVEIFFDIPVEFYSLKMN